MISVCSKSNHLSLISEDYDVVNQSSLPIALSRMRSVKLQEYNSTGFQPKRMSL